MRKVNYFKLALDFLMLMVFLILFNTRLIAGQTFHEIAGLAIGLAFIVHLSINWRWIKQVTVNIFRRITNRARLAYVVDVLLLITMGYIVVSGILISKVLFPDLNGGNNSFFRNTHLSASYFALLLLGIHLGLHWHWVRETMKKMFGIKQKKIMPGYIVRAVLVIVLAFGLYTIYSTNYFDKLTMLGTAFTQNRGELHARGFADSAGQGERPEQGSKGLGKGGHSEQGHNDLSHKRDIILSNLGIVAVFTTITYYLDRIISQRRSRPFHS